MKLLQLMTACGLILSLATGSALGQDEKAKKQAEVKKATAAALQKFNKADRQAGGRSCQGAGLCGVNDLWAELSGWRLRRSRAGA